MEREEIMRIKEKMKRFMALGLGCGIILSLMPGELTVQAAENSTVHNECSLLQEEQISGICDTVIENITESHAGIYTYDGFDVTIYNERQEDGNIIVDVDVLAERVLIRNPQDSPYVQGMKAEIDALDVPEEKETAMLVLDAYLQQANRYYNVPVTIAYCYQIYVPDAVAVNASSTAYDIYHRVDAEDGVILTKMEENETFAEAYDAEDGQEYIATALKNNAQVLAVSYNKDDAVDYAVEHATDEPEYSSANGNGSDCANFVSKCVNAGGIPQDKTGGYSKGWYPGSLNWIRTGYNGTDGVVLYLSQKNYFGSVSSTTSVTLGSIMFYNDKSHVAIVTLIDGSTINYSHHSSSAKPYVYYEYNSKSDNVTFYVPKV